MESVPYVLRDRYTFFYSVTQIEKNETVYLIDRLAFAGSLACTVIIRDLFA